MADDFDWSLGVPDDTGDVETTPGERGAQDAVPNKLSVRAALSAEDDEQETDTGDGDAGAADTGTGRTSAAVEAEAGDGTDGEQGESGDDDGLILGKFKTREDLEAAYTNLERHAGQQGSAVGDLRRELDEMRGTLSAYTEQQNEPQHAQINDDLVNQVDELAAQNPQGAAVWALENQPLLYNRVMQIWAGNDSLGASRFENAMMREQLKQEMTETMEAQYGPVAASVTEATQATQFDNAWRDVAKSHPDLDSHANAMMEAAASAPELATALQTGDMASKVRLIDNLYWLAKGRQADSMAVAAADLGRKQQQQSAAEKRGATVASGSSSQARGEKTGIETWKEQFLEAPSTSIIDGLKSK